MIDDIENKGYGLPYLGIKPTAVGVVQLPPMPMMPVANPVVNIPPPVKVPTDQNPAHVSTPLPISRPQITTTPQPLKTTQRPISNAQLLNNQPKPAIPNTADFSKIVTGPVPINPLLPPDYKKGDVIPGLFNEEYNFPPSLQPQPVNPPQQQKPVFNNLTNLLKRK